ncbi:hypothetical protein V494_03675 [Pseudogymnoascus sp. VKM F-4513 (FW-928)]|nr:hypothetical protein V494_03675 [Pseudogymnoascus sp. VKM F-4513 (FW-928)]
MPSIAKVFLAVATAFAFASAAPAPEINNPAVNYTVSDNDPRVTFEMGRYNTEDPLSKRTAPAGCNFEGTRGDFSYIKINTFGGDPASATILLVAKDGWKSTSKAGAWEGNFFLGTTAFKNRDTAFMEEGLLKFDQKATTIYWSRGSDMATIRTGQSTCKKA